MGERDEVAEMCSGKDFFQVGPGIFSRTEPFRSGFEEFLKLGGRISYLVTKGSGLTIHSIGESSKVECFKECLSYFTL